MLTVYSKKDAAKKLGISVATLDRFKRLGKVPCRQIGDRVIFEESDLVAFLDNCAVPASCPMSEAEKRNMAKRASL